MGKLKLGYDKLPFFKELNEEIKNNFMPCQDELRMSQEEKVSAFIRRTGNSLRQIFVQTSVE